MAGFDHKIAAEVIGNSSQYRIEAAIAIGRIGDPSQLPDVLRAREFPSPRRPVSEIAFLGTMPSA